MRKVRSLFVFLVLGGFSTDAFAAATYLDLTRNELFHRGEIVFVGKPTSDPSSQPCPNEIGKWAVTKVLKGDSSLEGKVVSILPFNPNGMITVSGGNKVPHFQPARFDLGKLDYSPAPSILFLKRNPSGCFELVAEGSQLKANEEPDVAALYGKPSDRSMRLQKGTLKTQCIPGQGGATMFHLTNGKEAFPHLTMTWWGTTRPLPENGKFKITADAPGADKGIAATYCEDRRDCKTLKNLQFKFDWAKGPSMGTLEYSFDAEGQPLSGAVLIERAKDEKLAVCN